MLDKASLNAARPLTVERNLCSLDAGWRNTLLRGYKEPVLVEDYATTPTPDQKIVVVTAGSCQIEGRRLTSWERVGYRPGHIGLVAPGESAKLRWNGPVHHHTLQLHVPGDVVQSVGAELFGSTKHIEPLHALALTDPVVVSTVLAMERAVRASAPEIYGETAAHFLVSHLLLRFQSREVRVSPGLGSATLRDVEEYLRTSLSRPVSLSELAELAGVSRFQLLRATKREWGETPHQRLMRLRVERAQELLSDDRLPVGLIAIECGFANAGHLTTCFKKHIGVAPSRFRRQVRL